MARSMLKEMMVSTTLWAEAVATAVHILNRSPSSAVQNITPYEVLKGEKPSVGYFRVFECIAHMLIDSQFRKKLDSKTQRCVFIGYCEETKGYKLFDPESEKVKISRNVCFFEDVHWDCWFKPHTTPLEYVIVNTHVGNTSPTKVQHIFKQIPSS